MWFSIKRGHLLQGVGNSVSAAGCRTPPANSHRLHFLVPGVVTNPASLHMPQVAILEILSRCYHVNKAKPQGEGRLLQSLRASPLNWIVASLQGSPVAGQHLLQQSCSPSPLVKSRADGNFL